MNGAAHLRCAPEFASRYGDQARAALAQSIVPFWWRTIDRVHGGVFNCWNNAGTALVSRDKFTWSQGRFVWLWSRLADVTSRGLLPPIAGGAYLAHAEKTVQFLEAHAFLPDGRCAFLLSEDGCIKEALIGRGPAPSIYADCFVVMGFAEYARVTGDLRRLDAAWRLFEHIEQRIAAGGFPTHPEPTPEGYDAHGIAMIFLNLTLVLREACDQLRDVRASAARARSLAAAARIFDQFLLPDGRIVDMRSRAGDETTLLSRHHNPGHALEALWMLLTVAHDAGRADWLARAHQAIRFSLESAWDAAHGGILHYVDRAGGPPTGIRGDSAYEKKACASWDTKLWWVHSEAIYATALSYSLTGDAEMGQWYERVWDYSFRVFPQPVRAIGEWIQIRDRLGNPLDRVVALPVKDPYHIARNLIQVMELFSGGPKPFSFAAPAEVRS